MQVPESSGPGPQDPSTILWMYHSHNSEQMGFLWVVCGG